MPNSRSILLLEIENDTSSVLESIGEVLSVGITVHVGRQSQNAPSINAIYTLVESALCIGLWIIKRMRSINCVFINMTA